MFSVNRRRSPSTPWKRAPRAESRIFWEWTFARSVSKEADSASRSSSSRENPASGNRFRTATFTFARLSVSRHTVRTRIRTIVAAKDGSR